MIKALGKCEGDGTYDGDWSGGVAILELGACVCR